MNNLKKKLKEKADDVKEQWSQFYNDEGDALFTDIEKYKSYQDFEEDYHKRYQSLPLIHAIRCNNSTIVKKLFLKGANVNTIDKYEFNPLYYALKEDNPAIVKVLLEHGANKEASFTENYCKISYFQRACESSYREIVKLFLDYGCDVNTAFWNDTWECPNGSRPLHIAIVYERLDVLKLLISCNADVNMTNEEGETPLHVACELNFTEAVKLLLSKNALVNVKTRNYLTPLYKCVRNENYEIIKLLLEHGLYLDSENSETMMYLYALLEKAISNGYTKILEDFLKCGLDVNKRFFSQRNRQITKTLLHAAVEYDQWDVIGLLLEYNANINIKDDNGKLPIHIAAQKGTKSVIKQLLQQDLQFQVSPKFSSLHAEDKKYWTPLHEAIRSHSVECIEYLLECGSDLGAQTVNDETPLHLACKMKEPRIVELLVRRGASLEVVDSAGDTALHIAVGHSCAASVELLLEAGAKPLVCNKSGQIPLGRALAVNSKECAELLLSHSPDVNVKQHRIIFHDLLRTPHLRNCELAGVFFRHGYIAEPPASPSTVMLFHAVVGRHLDVLEQHVNEGADVNATFGGQRLLHIAAACRHYEVVEALIARGVDLRARNADGRLAIYHAYWSGEQRLVELFLNNGLEPRELPELFHYPIHVFIELASCGKPSYSRRHDYTGMLDALIARGADVNHCDEEGQNGLHLVLRYLQSCRQTNETYCWKPSRRSSRMRRRSKWKSRYCSFSNDGEGQEEAAENKVDESNDGDGGMQNEDEEVEEETGDDDDDDDDDEEEEENDEGEDHEVCSTASRSRSSKDLTEARIGINLFKYLLRSGVNVNAKTRTGGEGPLHLAVGAYYSKMSLLVQTLLDRPDLYLDSQTEAGDSALHLACRKGSAGLAARLLECGAELETFNAAGRLPIDELPGLAGLRCSGLGVSALVFRLRELAAELLGPALAPEEEAELEAAAALRHDALDEYPYLRRLAELREAGLQLLPRNARHLGRLECAPLLADCRFELKRLSILGPVRELLSAPEHRLPRLARHPALLRLVRYALDTRAYPHYQQLLYRRLCRCVWRAGLVRAAADALGSFLFVRLPDVCLEAVLDYLSDLELEQLCRAAHENSRDTARLYEQLTFDVLSISLRDVATASATNVGQSLLLTGC